MDNSMENVKKITNYMILLDKKLGEGAFGKVYIGEEDDTKRKVAIKILEKKKSMCFPIQLTKKSTSRTLCFPRFKY